MEQFSVEGVIVDFFLLVNVCGDDWICYPVKKLEDDAAVFGRLCSENFALLNIVSNKCNIDRTSFVDSRRYKSETSFDFCAQRVRYTTDHLMALACWYAEIERANKEKRRFDWNSAEGFLDYDPFRWTKSQLSFVACLWCERFDGCIEWSPKVSMVPLDVMVKALGMTR